MGENCVGQFILYFLFFSSSFLHSILPFAICVVIPFFILLNYISADNVMYKNVVSLTWTSGTRTLVKMGEKQKKQMYTL
jgi:hypothetical protein